MSENDFKDLMLRQLNQVQETLGALGKSISDLTAQLGERCPARAAEIMRIRTEVEKNENDLNAAFKKLHEVKAEVTSLTATLTTLKWAAGVIGAVIGAAVSIGVTLLLKMVGA